MTEHYCKLKLIIDDAISTFLAVKDTVLRLLVILLIVSLVLELKSSRTVINSWNQSQKQIRNFKVNGKSLSEIIVPGSVIVIPEQNIACMKINDTAKK